PGAASGMRWRHWRSQIIAEPVLDRLRHLLITSRPNWTGFKHKTGIIRMKKFRGFVTGAVAVAFILSLAQTPAAAQAPAAQRRIAGKPDFNGIWQSLNSAAWDLQDHVGALGVPPGQGVVEGNDIPYRPAALAQQRE